MFKILESFQILKDLSMGLLVLENLNGHSGSITSLTYSGATNSILVTKISNIVFLFSSPRLRSCAGVIQLKKITSAAGQRSCSGPLTFQELILLVGGQGEAQGILNGSNFAESSLQLRSSFVEPRM